MAGLSRQLASGISAAFLVIAGRAYAAPAPPAVPETDHLTFVNEYIRELSELESIRKQAAAEMKEPGSSPFISTIHYTTRVHLALASDIATMMGMQLKGQFDFLPKEIAQYYALKDEVASQMERIASAVVEGPQPGVDYSKFAVEMPKLRARGEVIDDAFLKISVLVFSTLIDQTPDKQNHLSHLIITKQQQTDLLRALKSGFGVALDEKNAPYLTAAAGVIEDFLHKAYKCADDPWD